MPVRPSPWPMPASSPPPCAVCSTIRLSARRAPPPRPALPPTTRPCSTPCSSASHPGSTASPPLPIRPHMPQAPEFWARPGLVSDLLAPLGWAYGAAGAARRAMTPATRVNVPTICVGNLTAGGAGKTPVVLSLAQLFNARGRRPHILSRGYGGNLNGPLQVDPARHSASEVGDEPLLLAATAPT